MKCPKCGADAPQGAQFCMACGQRLAAPQPPPEPQQPQQKLLSVPSPTPDPYATFTKKNRAWWIVGGVAALVALLLFGLGASGVLGMGKRGRVASVLSSGLKPDVPFMERVGEPAGPVTEAGAAPAERLKMPDDVRAWLEHLERMEVKRKEIGVNELSGLMVTFATLQVGGSADVLKGLIEDDPMGPDRPTPAQDFSRDAARIREEFRALRDEFNSVQAPDECIPTQSSYNQTLGETGAMVNDVMDALSRSAQDPQGAIAALKRMQGGSAARVDAPAKESDRHVGAICAKYGERKWFSIDSDVGGGMLGKAGGLGL